MTKASDPGIRAAAYRAMGEVGGRAATELAPAGLEDPIAAVRAEAAYGVSAMAIVGEAIARLVEVLGDEDAAVRGAAADALGRLGRTAVEPVMDALFDPRREEGALAALQRLPVDGREARVREFASQAVARALRDAAVVDQLGGEPDDAVALVRDSLRAREQRNARAAFQAAALLGDRRSVSAALESLDVADARQRATALEVIETVAEPGVVRPLLSLWEPRPGNGLDPGAIERLCDDPDPWIRQCAKFAAVTREGGVLTHTLSVTVPLVERVILLRRVPLFEPLPPEDLQPIATVAGEEVFSEGELLAERGEYGDTMFVIHEGEVAVLGAKDEVVVTRGAGEFIGEMALISSQPRSASLRAQTHVRVLHIHKPDFEAILRERPDTALALMRVLCNRLVDAGGTARNEGRVAVGSARKESDLEHHHPTATATPTDLTTRRRSRRQPPICRSRSPRRRSRSATAAVSSFAFRRSPSASAMRRCGCSPTTGRFPVRCYGCVKAR